MDRGGVIGLESGWWWLLLLLLLLLSDREVVDGVVRSVVIINGGPRGPEEAMSVNAVPV